MWEEIMKKLGHSKLDSEFIVKSCSYSQTLVPSVQF